MKEKLEKYESFLICVTLVLGACISFYLYKFLIATIFLLILLAIILYECKNSYDDNKEMKLLVSKIKLNINDNISDMSYPVALIEENGSIVWANKRLKKELNIENI